MPKHKRKYAKSDKPPTAKKRRKPPASSKRPAQVKKLVVPHDHVAHVVVPSGMVPAILPGKVPHEIAIVPVEPKPVTESWMDYLFGPPEKLQSKP